MNSEKLTKLSLDDEPEPFIYIRSKEGKIVFMLKKSEFCYSKLLETIFIVDNKSNIGKDISEKNPFCISELSDENMSIIIRYMKICAKEGKEIDPPEHPLPKEILPNILKIDYPVFQELIESNIPDNKKISNLGSLIMGAAYFDMQKLLRKSCAVMAFMFMGKSFADIQKMTELSAKN